MALSRAEQQQREANAMDDELRPFPDEGAELLWSHVEPEATVVCYTVSDDWGVGRGVTQLRLAVKRPDGSGLCSLILETKIER